MPKFLLLSDLHLEFSDFTHPTPEESGADAVILAGDIAPKLAGLRWAQQCLADYAAVFYVPGNHEFYGDKLTLVEKLKAQSVGTNIQVLDNDATEFMGVRIIGSTLWTDFRLTGNEPLAMWDAQQTISDYKRIRDGRTGRYGKIRPAITATLHVQARRFIESELSKPFSGKTVVVTHHAPCELSIHDRYKQESATHLNAAYASRLDGLMGEGVAVWCHGHTHDSFDYDLCGTRVLCNPRGYTKTKMMAELEEGETNAGFNARKVFEV